jgi:hypothetical protein
MPAYLLDTNHVGMAVNRASIVGQRILQARLAGVRVGLVFRCFAKSRPACGKFGTR